MLPAVLAGLLAATFAMQLTLVEPLDLPPASIPPASAAPAALFAPGPLAAAGGLLSSNMFAPERTAGAAGVDAAAPLGGAVVAGTVSIRGRAYAMVIRPGGRIVRVAPGGAIDGWQLARLGPESAQFRRGTEKLELRYGGQAAAAPAEEESQ